MNTIFDLIITEEDVLSQGSSSQSRTRDPRHLSRESSYPELVLCKAMTLKVLSLSNKRDFIVYTLRDVTQENMQTPDSLKAMIFEQVGDAVSDKMDFLLGYYRKSEKVWINNEHDVHDAIQLMKEIGKVTLWCMGQDRTTTARKRERSGDDISILAKKKSVSEKTYLLTDCSDMKRISPASL